MHCTMCGNELILMNVVRDAVPGLEHHSFICSECHATDRQVVFTRYGRPDDTEPVPLHASPSTVPEVQDEYVDRLGFFGRVVARLRGN
jgi:hypothetical protein